MKQLILLVLLGLNIAGTAQTNPVVQSLPVTINFGATNFTPPFTNMAAWTGDGIRPYTNQAAAEASLPGANTTSVFAAAPVSGGQGGQYGHASISDARLTILQSSNSTNGTTQTALAINTMGVTAATVSYDLSLTIASLRDVGVVLQYRVGSAGAFTTIPGTAALYNSGTANGGDPDGSSDIDNYVFNLPAGALNQAEVQLRWASWQGTQSGARSGIGIDNISITAGSVVPCTEPIAQPTNLVLTAAPTSINGSFTAASPAANGYLVIRSSSSTLSASPVDGTVYAESQSLGGGVVIAAGNGTSFSDINLNPNSTYYYFVFSFNANACSGGPNYLTGSPLTASTTTLPIPPCNTPGTAPTALSLNPASTSISGSFTASLTATHYLIVRSINSSLGFTPNNGITYSAGQAFGPDTIVSYNTGNTLFASGLSPLTTYYFFVFAANDNCSGAPFYLSTPLTGNATTTASGGSGIPPGYYNAAVGLTCAPLKTALRDIITNNYISLGYTPGVWNAFQTTDQRINDGGTATIMWDMYGDNPTGMEPYTYTYGVNQCGNYNSEADCYNREHSFPQSWFNDASPMNSDINHIFPTDGYVNGRRGNQPYGEVSTPSWTSLNGGKLGPNVFSGYSGVVFEPRNEYKGDFARAQFYMVTRYETQAAGWQTNGNADEVLAGNTYPSYDNWYIQLLYKWHINDPVSQKEIDRNNAVYALQNNRNPFIDHPEYAALVWQCSGVIPVTLIDFTASRSGESVQLRWQTTQESRFRSYQVERSVDGRNFALINEIAGQNLGNYQYIDNQLPEANTVFYRLKMVDIDGQYRFSKILAIRLYNSSTGLFLFPNPSSSHLNLQLQKALTSNAQLQITNTEGNVVMQMQLAAGTKNLLVNMNQIPNGIYFFRLYDGNHYRVEKIQVSR